MASSTRARSPWRFGVFELDPHTGELRKHGVLIKLPGQPCQVLMALLERPGELVTREELRSRIWPDGTFVDFDHSLGTAVNRIREAFGDSATTPRFIETIPRRGFRFIAPIVSGEEPSTVRLPPVPSSRLLAIRSKLAAAVALLAVAAAAGTAAFYWRSREPPTAGMRTVAVLPFENLSHDPDQQFFVDGMTDELTTVLARIGSLRVIARTSMAPYKNTHSRLRDIGRELNAGAVLEGSVLRSGSRLRITAQLIDAHSEQHLWADSYEADLADIMKLQAEVAQAIAGQVRIRLTPQDRTRLAVTRPVNPEAYVACLRGRHHWLKLTVSGFRLALASYQEAIQKDPDYAPAWSGLADCYHKLADFGAEPASEMAPKAREAALTALRLDDTLGQAHASLAAVLFFLDDDFVSAGKEFRRALELDPGYPIGHIWYAAYLVVMDRRKEALAEVDKALELDPVSLHTNGAGALIYYWGRDYDRAARQFRTAIELYPNERILHNFLADVYEAQGSGSAAFDEHIKAENYSKATVAALRTEFKRIGVNAYWRKELRDSRAGPFSPERKAEIYAMLGEKDHAFEWLERSPLLSLKVNPRFDSLRSDPRFAVLTRRAGLP